MLKIAIVENEPAELRTMQEYVQRYFSSLGEPVEISCFDDGDKFVEEYPSPDIIFMDIEMKRMDGISAARKIRAFDERALLLFVTNMVNLALEGYSVDASDFVIKPLSYDSFCARMERTMRKLDSRRDKFIEIKSGGEKLIVNLKDISFVEASNRKLIIHKTDGTGMELNSSLNALESQLGDSFFRCHNAFLVNMGRVTTVTVTEAIADGKTVPISKHRKKEFMTALTNFRGRIL